MVADIENLAGNPRPHGVEKLAAKEKLHRVYVGPGKDYRVIYQLQDEALLIVVVEMGDRKDVYPCAERINSAARDEVTGELCGSNPFDYPTQLQRHADESAGPAP